jgi:hypothetical protein
MMAMDRGMVVGRQTGMSTPGASLDTVAKLSEALTALKGLEGIGELAPAVKELQSTIDEVHKLTETLIEDSQKLSDQQDVHLWLIQRLYEKTAGISDPEFEVLLKEAQEATRPNCEDAPKEGT